MHRLYFTNSRNSTASLADYYYPYKYEVDNTNVSTQQGKNAEDATSNNNVNSTSDATSSNTKPVKENVAKIAAKVPPSAKVKNNGTDVENAKQGDQTQIEETNENYYKVGQDIPADNSIGNSRLLLAKASQEYNSDNYKDAIITLNTVLNKTANKEVIDDANWYLALCYLKRTNKEQAIKLLKLQSEFSTHYDIAQELIQDLE